MSDVPRLNLTINQGATFSRTFTVVDDGTPRNLAGYSARMQIRRSPSASLAKATWDTDTWDLVIDPLIGQIVLEVSAEDTAALTFSVAAWDLELEAPDGWVDRLLEGSVTLSREVTRPEPAP